MASNALAKYNALKATMTRYEALNVIQAAYHGHHARRSFGAVRPSHDGNPPAILAGNSDMTVRATTLDGIQPTINAGNSCPSLDGNKQAEPCHSGSSVLSAAAEVFLPNDADFGSKTHEPCRHMQTRKRRA